MGGCALRTHPPFFIVSPHVTIFYVFYLTAQPRGQNPRNYGQAKELQRKKRSANIYAIISYSLKEYKFLFYQ